MIEKPPSYNLRVIRNLLKGAFDAVQLDILCFDYYSSDVYQRFSPQMETDIKITLLLEHCLKLPTGLDELLKIVRKDSPDVFKQFESEIYAIYASRQPNEEPPSVTEITLLLVELDEWKLIHKDTQKLLFELENPLNLLTRYRFENNPELLTDAGLKWQRLCAGKLKTIFDKWKFKYATTEKQKELQEKSIQTEMITRRLMTDLNRNEFRELYFWMMGLQDILWSLLNVSDENIVSLVNRLQLIMAE